MHGKPPDCRMLSDVYRGADKTLAVHEVWEGEGEVRGLLQRPLRTIERLDVPFSESDEVARQQVSKRKKRNRYVKLRHRERKIAQINKLSCSIYIT